MIMQLGLELHNDALSNELVTVIASNEIWMTCDQLLTMSNEEIVVYFKALSNHPPVETDVETEARETGLPVKIRAR
jgi:hypothetical protein